MRLRLKDTLHATVFAAKQKLLPTPLVRQPRQICVIGRDMEDYDLFAAFF